MKFPNWFRIVWWLLLILILAILLFYRRTAFVVGDTNSTDIFLLGIFAAIMLVPVFSEMEILGVKLKQEIAELKEDLRIKIGEIKNQIENKQHQTVHTTIQGVPLPASDFKLDKLQADIADLLKRQSDQNQNADVEDELSLGVPEKIQKAFKIRFLFEKELARISSEAGLESGTVHKKMMPFRRIVDQLIDMEYIDRDLGQVLLQIFAICSVSIHDGELTETQTEFLEANWRTVYLFLKSL